MGGAKEETIGRGTDKAKKKNFSHCGTNDVVFPFGVQKEGQFNVEKAKVDKGIEPSADRVEQDGPISFDEACFSIHKKHSVTKKKNKQKKNVPDLGRKTEIIPSCYTNIGLRKEFREKKSRTVLEVVETAKDPISNGESFLCTFLSDRNIRSYNSRLCQNNKCDVGKKLWDSITKLGVLSVGEDSMSIKLIEFMEMNDKRE